MFEQFVQDLMHDDPAVRYEAAQKLGASNDSRAIQPLITALPDTNAKVQYAAFSGLIKLNAYEAAEPVVDMLLNNLNSRVWELLKLNIGLRLRSGLLEIVEGSNAPVVEPITEALNTFDLDEQQRALLVRILGRSADSARVDMLITYLVKGSPAIQGAAAEALGYIGDERAIAPLLLLVHDQSNELREIAAEALGRIGNERAFEPLVAMLKDENEWVRRAAVVALGDLGDRRAIEPLSELLQDETNVVQDAAFEALQKLSYGKLDMTL
ncbi:MAG: HEAT repeat domain-containing protein [Anaerolineae bacterium]|nr:HEAT repeat domain-containing protein [Anaerolineae bacterium]